MHIFVVFVGFGSHFTTLIWVGLGWIHHLVGWVRNKWRKSNSDVLSRVDEVQVKLKTHVQRPTYTAFELTSETVDKNLQQ